MLLEFSRLLMPETSDLESWCAGAGPLRLPSLPSGINSGISGSPDWRAVLDGRQSICRQSSPSQPAPFASTRRLLRDAQFAQLLKQVPRRPCCHWPGSRAWVL